MNIKDLDKIQNKRIDSMKNDIYPTYNNPSYDKSLSPEKRLYDFLGKYYINLNGVKPNNIPEITQLNKKEIIDFVLDLLSQTRQNCYKEMREFIINNETDSANLFCDAIEVSKLDKFIKDKEL